MGRRGLALLLSTALLSVAALTQAASASAFMTVGGRTTQPIGHYEFCQTAQAECLVRTSNPVPVELTRTMWTTLVEVNSAVNASVEPKTDFEMWGREEVWSYPTSGYGDCEDYVLEKRRLLNRAGVPLANLLITVVRQPNGDGHAVLTVTTNLGDFILDNLEAKVLPWTETPYLYLKRQSAKNAGVWVSINDGRNVAVGSVR